MRVDYLYAFLLSSISVCSISNAENYRDEWKRSQTTIKSGVIHFKHIRHNESDLTLAKGDDLKTIEADFRAETFDLSKFCGKYVDWVQFPYAKPWGELTLYFGEAGRRQERREPYKPNNPLHDIVLFEGKSKSFVIQRYAAPKSVHIYNSGLPMTDLRQMVLWPNLDNATNLQSKPDPERENAVILTFNSQIRDAVAEVDLKSGFVYRYAASWKSGKLAEITIQDAPKSVNGYTIPGRRLDVSVNSDGKIKGIEIFEIDDIRLNIDPGDVFFLTANIGVPVHDHRSEDGKNSSKRSLTPQQPLRLPDLTPIADNAKE